MLIHLDQNDLRFLAHLGMSPDWQALKSLLSKELAEADKQLRTLPPTELARVQGVAQWLDDLLDTVETARSKLK